MKEEKLIPTRRFWRISSTYDYAKSQREKGKELFIVAKTQSKGRGRNERAFSSKLGGLYLTWLHYPEDLPSRRAFTLVQRGAVAVCKTLESYGVTPTIKWPNDVLVDGKKICGILTENTLRGEKIACSVIGVGVNVNNRLEEELQAIATTLKEVIGKKVAIGEFEKRLKKNLLSGIDEADYFDRLGCLGEVEIVENGVAYPAIAEGVDEDGLLVVTVEGRRQKKSAAEISLRQRKNV